MTNCYFIPPFTVDDTSLGTSNVYETVPTAYNAGTTYALGDIVSVDQGDESHIVYQSLQGSNTGNTPSSSPAWWQEMGTVYAAYNAGTTYAINEIVTDTTNHLLYQSAQGSNLGNALTETAWWTNIGPSNKWAMFDAKSSTQTQWTDSVGVTIDVTGRATAVALFNVDAASVNITVNDATAVEQYNQDHSLVINEGIDDWLKYFTEPIRRKTDIYISGLPNIANPEVIVTVTADGTVKVGTLGLGYATPVGDTQYGAQVGITDYSRITEDDFGNFSIVQRGYNKRGQFTIWIDSGDTDFIYKMFADYRATPCIFIGADSFGSTVLYGLLKDWGVVLQYPSHHIIDLQFQGL